MLYRFYLRANEISTVPGQWCVCYSLIFTWATNHLCYSYLLRTCYRINTHLLWMVDLFVSEDFIMPVLINDFHYSCVSSSRALLLSSLFHYLSAIAPVFFKSWSNLWYSIMSFCLNFLVPRTGDFYLNEAGVAQYFPFQIFLTAHSIWFGCWRHWMTVLANDIVQYWQHSALDVTAGGTEGLVLALMWYLDMCFTSIPNCTEQPY